jgi:hypothetical protein
MQKGQTFLFFSVLCSCSHGRGSYVPVLWKGAPGIYLVIGIFFTGGGKGCREGMNGIGWDGIGRTVRTKLSPRRKGIGIGIGIGDGSRCFCRENIHVSCS